ncbi:MAG TPA: hypothetical protein VG273_10765 [Bryobacteraceae bacterium]|jgi:hypothetical protein|nr:hypothetical protein [Bryobacteraceae bacterium]
MTVTPGRVAAILGLFFVSSACGQVIFSRRVYREHGPSYQQIWMWNPADGVLKELTHSPRDHRRPECKGSTVEFTTPSPDLRPAVLWSLNPATDQEKPIGPVPTPQSKPNSRKENCAVFAKTGDVEACGNDETLVLSRSGREIGRFQIQVNTCPIDRRGTIGKCDTPIRSLDGSEDGKWLLIGEEGLNDASGQRQDDYYLVDLAAMKLRPVASAETAFWLPGRDEILYVTPRDLTPLPDANRKHSVWAQQLEVYDPAKGVATAITSGLTNNVDPAWCQASGQP